MKLFQILGLAALALTLSAPAMAEHGGKHHGGKRGHMFERADANKDGVLTRAEFRAKSDHMFAKLDLNKDGRITRAESDAAKAKWHQKRLDKRGSRGHVEGSKVILND